MKPSLLFVLAGAGLFSSSLVHAQENPWLAPDGTEKTADDPASLEGKPTVAAKLTFDVSPRPEDNGGNLFLVGFVAVDDEGSPIQASKPADFKQVGIWVQDWPLELDVELVEGLHYRALYGYSEHPSAGDMTSKTFHTDKLVDGAYSLTILPSPKTDLQDLPKGTPPSAVEVVTKAPDDLQEQATRVHINIEPPPPSLEGVIFLTGFASYDEVLGMPPRGAEPEHFIVIGTDVEALPYSTETQLKPGFAYFAMLGNGAHPESGDRMSRAVLFEGGAEDLQITITDQEVGKPPKEAPAIAQEIENPGPGEEVTDEPLPSKGRNLFVIIGSIVLGGLGGWWLQQRKKKDQGSGSRLKRVGESDESS